MVKANSASTPSQQAKIPPVKKSSKKRRHKKKDSSDVVKYEESKPDPENSVAQIPDEIVPEKINSSQPAPAEASPENELSEKQPQKKKTRDGLNRDESSTSHQSDPRMSRTIFIGNIPVGTKPLTIKRLVKPFGNVETVRYRGIVSENPGLPKRAALHSGRTHPNVDTLSAYVVFGEEGSENAMERACKELNMRLLEGKHLRVTPAAQEKCPPRRSVFVGNLPFDITEEVLLDAFMKATEQSGFNVVGARVMRDKQTGIGRGIGFVSFDDELAVRQCLAMEEKLTLAGRTLRVTAVTKKAPGGPKKVKWEKGNRREPKFAGKRKSFKR